MIAPNAFNWRPYRAFVKHLWMRTSKRVPLELVAAADIWVISVGVYLSEATRAIA